MSGGGGGRRRRHHEEEHENHERWLVTYADMLTVLMALFIVMFALSVVDKKKFEDFKAGLQDDISVGTGPTLLDGGTGLQENPGPSMALDVQAAMAAYESQQQSDSAAAQELATLEKAREAIHQALVDRGMEASARFLIDERGLVVTIVTDEVMFDLGSATLRPSGAAVLDAVAPALVPLPNPVTVEGHTDNLPISGGRFPSNWELSAERATSVLRYILETHHVPATRLSAAGYADQRPVAENHLGGQPANRRVEVIVRAIAKTEAAEAASSHAPTDIPLSPSRPDPNATEVAVAASEEH